jgi:arginine-tRNA-protein transferase
MIYSFYDPEHETRTGLGNYIILDHILRAARSGLPYVYLGYWVEGSARMQYKVRYRPLERLGREGWERFDPRDQARAIGRAAVAPSRAGVPVLDGGGKDGVPGGQGQYRFTK